MDGLGRLFFYWPAEKFPSGYVGDGLLIGVAAAYSTGELSMKGLSTRYNSDIGNRFREHNLDAEIGLLF